ncbi:hypothetical protein L6452_12146 [Arctium lappa]|uniref:Uncharacterized protein n=1 Tax=Arctium lappa TaxID=4217 RepID=A0ACB9DQ37_ARCLA|nr:hypothetical protein L6452_12146 [Arctium lappa]
MAFQQISEVANEDENKYISLRPDVSNFLISEGMGSGNCLVDVVVKRLWLWPSQQITKVAHDDGSKNIPMPPDVINYMIFEIQVKVNACLLCLCYHWLVDRPKFLNNQFCLGGDSCRGLVPSMVIQEICNVVLSLNRDFGDGLLQQITKVHDDGSKNILVPPDVINYMISELAFCFEEWNATQSEESMSSFQIFFAALLLGHVLRLFVIPYMPNIQNNTFSGKSVSSTGSLTPTSDTKTKTSYDIEVYRSAEKDILRRSDGNGLNTGSMRLGACAGFQPLLNGHRLCLEHLLYLLHFSIKFSFSYMVFPVMDKLVLVGQFYEALIRDFDNGLPQQITEVANEDENKYISLHPDVSNLLIFEFRSTSANLYRLSENSEDCNRKCDQLYDSENDASALNGSTDALDFDVVADVESRSIFSNLKSPLQFCRPNFTIGDQQSTIGIQQSASDFNNLQSTIDFNNRRSLQFCQLAINSLHFNNWRLTLGDQN